MSRTAIISVDGHVKASRAGYREYIEEKYHDDYDESVKAAEEAGLPDAGNLNPEYGAESQWDSDRRLEALEGQGVVAEVLFPNGQPFQVNRLEDFGRAGNAELAAAGRRAYNRWLADFCAEAPGRRAGQAVVSFDDIDQAVEDIHWAKELGLGRDHDAGAQPRRDQLLRPGARPDLGRHPGRGPAGQPARRCRSSRLQLAGVRGDHDARGRERLLLQSVVVAADRRRCLRPIPRASGRVHRDAVVLPDPGDRPHRSDAELE